MLLKQLNIGRDTLNQELSYMGQPIIDNVNAKLSDLNYAFLVDYFQSQEMNDLKKATGELNKCRRKLDDFYLREFKPNEPMSDIEKSINFNLKKATEELNKCRRKLGDFFLREFKPIDQMSEIEKSLYFKWIIRYGGNYMSFQRLFPQTNSLTFSDTIFEQLYKWYEMWMMKSEEEKKQDWNSITWTATPLKSGICIDEETAIMSALKNGDGDAFGF